MELDRELLSHALPAYDIGDEVARGGFGVVVDATHRNLGRRVAVKQLPRDFAADPGFRRRFASEARLLASLDHPHVVAVYDYVESEDACLLVMELLPGGTVWQRFTSRGVSPQAACTIAVATCTALDFAHRKGILHRDIKPQNLLFTAGGSVKVADFGIAKVLGETHARATKTGEVLGTPFYMAPEQALGSGLSPATDVYQLGVVVYELLAGRLPFPDDGDALAIVARHIHGEKTPLSESAPHIPAPVAETVMRAQAREPADRHATAEDFGVALAQACNDAWGRGWVRQAGIPVIASGAIADRLSGSTDAGAGSLETLVHAGPPAAVVSTVPSEVVETPAPEATPLAPPPPPSQAVPAAAVQAPPAPPPPGAPLPPGAPPPPLGAPGGAPRASRTWVWLLAVAVPLAVVAALVTIWVMGGDDDEARDGSATDTTEGEASPSTTDANGSATITTEPVVRSVTVPGTQQFVDTGVEVRAGDVVAISANGEVFNNATSSSGPDGLPDPGLQQFSIVPSAGHGALIVRIGESGEPFAAGDSAVFTATASGPLFLGINDVGVDNNSGEYDATVSVARD